MKYDCLVLVFSGLCWVSGNFPKTTWRACKAARRLIPFYVYFWVPHRNFLVAWADCQATQLLLTSLWVLYEWPSGEDHSLGDASHDGSILMFLSFLSWLWWEKRKNLLVNHWNSNNFWIALWLQVNWEKLYEHSFRVWKFGIFYVLGFNHCRMALEMIMDMIYVE